MSWGRASRASTGLRSDPRVGVALLGAAMMLVAVNLRPAAASVGPLLVRIESQAGISSGWAGALATLPVLCFGVLAPVAPMLSRRLGVRGAVTLAMWALLAGLLVRVVGGVGLLFLGTALAGAAVAIGNVLLPVLVRRDFERRAGTAMALFTAALIGFAALAAGVTVPVANALGGGWQPGLAVWALPAGLAALIWTLPRLRHDPAGSRSDASPATVARSATRRLLKAPLAWQVTLFFALQSGGFYAMLAWLPSIYTSHGASQAHAGVLLSVSMVVGIGTALTFPGLASRLRDQRMLVVVCCLLTAAGWIGILLAPTSAPYLWVVLLGLGQNASFSLALMLIVLRSGSVASTQRLSTLAQTVGYVLAAFVPVALGAIHSAARSWTPDVIVLLALVLPQFLFGLGAARDRRLPSDIASDVAPPGPSPPAVAQR